VVFERRMTVAKLADGGLWLHSPVDPLPEFFDAVSSLGPVRHIVAPNRLHDRYVNAWLERFPEAEFWSSPGFIQTNPAMRVRPIELTDDARPPWGDELLHCVLAGSPILSEVWFCHRASRTLIVTDAIQNHDTRRDGWYSGLLKKLSGVAAPHGGSPRDWRLIVRDRAALRESVDRMLAWDFDRLIVCHGVCVETGARTFVERGMSWLKS